MMDHACGSGVPNIAEWAGDVLAAMDARVEMLLVTEEWSADRLGKLKFASNARNHHLDIVEAPEEAVTVGAIVVVIDLMLLAVILLVVQVGTDAAFEILVILTSPVALRIHVIATGPIGAKVSIAAIALPSRRTMASGTTVILAGPVSGREYLSAITTLKHVDDECLREGQ